MDCVVVLPFDCWTNCTDEETGEMIDFLPPAPWYIVNAADERVFIKRRSRAEAQQVVNFLYGAGKYTVRAAYHSTQSTKSYTVNAA